MIKIIKFILALVSLIITLPIITLFAILIFFETRQFPIYTELRSISLTHKRFKIYKLRTIKSRGIEEQKLNNQNNIFIKKYLLKSLTKSGKILRKTGLDEIPQLINILKGEMSFIGPRPFNISELKKMKNYFPELYQKKENILSKPGITGFWQIFGNREDGIVNLISCDMFYEKNRNTNLDLKILLRTFKIILSGKHSDSIVFNSDKEINSLKTIFQT